MYTMLRVVFHAYIMTYGMNDLLQSTEPDLYMHLLFWRCRLVWLKIGKGISVLGLTLNFAQYKYRRKPSNIPTQNPILSFPFHISKYIFSLKI